MYLTYVAPATSISTILALTNPDNVATNSIVDTAITKTRTDALFSALQIITGVRRSITVTTAMRHRTAVAVVEAGKI